MIGVEARHLVWIQTILRETVPEFEVRAFGSRVHGTGLKPFSDLDLAIMTTQPLTITQLSEIKDAFSESNLPFRVDIVDWAATGKEFQTIIGNHYEVVQTPRD